MPSWLVTVLNHRKIHWELDIFPFCHTLGTVLMHKHPNGTGGLDSGKNSSQQSSKMLMQNLGFGKNGSQQSTKVLMQNLGFGKNGSPQSAKVLMQTSLGKIHKQC
jgi:hypothetical protein